MSWDIDTAVAARLARERFGIAEPVEIHVLDREELLAMTGIGGDAGDAAAEGLTKDWIGWATWREETRVHEVFLVRHEENFCIAEMLRTLAHELTHCRQAERCDGPQEWHLMYDALRNFMEGEARTAEARWRELGACIRPADVVKLIPHNREMEENYGSNG